MKTLDYLECPDNIEAHVTAAKTMEGEGDFWGAHNHYLRCSGLSGEIMDRKRFETLADEMKVKAVTKMVLDSNLRIVAHLETIDKACTDKAGKPLREITVGWMMENYWMNHRDGHRLIYANFNNAVDRVRDKYRAADDAVWKEHLSSLEEGELPMDRPVTISKEDLTIGEIIDWLNLDPPEMIP
jgi:hypothetical protein